MIVQMYVLIVIYPVIKLIFFFHITLDCPTTNISLLSTFNDFLSAMQSMPLVFENDVLALMSFFLFIYQFPYCLFFSPKKNCQGALVRAIKWNSSAPYWIAVRHCMLRKSFLAFIAILFLFDCFVFVFVFLFMFFAFCFFLFSYRKLWVPNYESENYDEEASLSVVR